MKRLALLLLLAPACYGGTLPKDFSFALNHPQPAMQTAGDDLAQAFANHGVDSTLAPILATGFEWLISNNKALLDRLTADEAAIATLQKQVAALTPAPPAPTPGAIYTLSFGLASDANGAVLGGLPLANAVVKGSIFIFTAPAGAPTNTAPANITKVDYFLDGTLFHTEGVTPFNFNGDGNPWNTATVANGAHTIKQLVTLTNGTTETDTVSITVAN